MSSPLHCVIHGSFNRHFDAIQDARKLFVEAGVEVLAPKVGQLNSSTDGFGLFEDEVGQDPRLIELLYLDNLKRLGPNGFSYFVSPGGYIGQSASYELGIAQATNIRCLFSAVPSDHPAYIPANSVWSPDRLATYIQTNRALPGPTVRRNERLIHRLWQDLIVPGSIVAAGAIIEHESSLPPGQKEILLVKTHKWGHRYSIVGGRVRRNERLNEALIREVKEETGLAANPDRHICTFDQIKVSEYHQPSVQHIFVDNVVKVKTKKVVLNEEAEDYIWTRPGDALAALNIEPNARKTITYYLQSAV